MDNLRSAMTIDVDKELVHGIRSQDFHYMAQISWFGSGVRDSVANVLMRRWKQKPAQAKPQSLKPRGTPWNVLACMKDLQAAHYHAQCAKKSDEIQSVRMSDAWTIVLTGKGREGRINIKHLKNRICALDLDVCLNIEGNRSAFINA
eukprot:1136313-Pelagomonas_calceolata.AAC.10